MKKRVVPVVWLLIMISFMVGCQQTDNMPEQKTMLTEKDVVTLKITWWGGQVRHDYTQKLLDKYTELHPHIHFEAIPSGWDGYFDRLSTQAASGSMPDIVQMDYLYISTYTKNGSIMDMQQFIDNGTIDVSDIDENVLNTGLIGGKLTGMVISTSMLAVGYNDAVLKEAGIDELTNVWTWEDYMAINKEIKERTGKTGSAVGPVDDTNMFQYWVRQQGENLFSEDAKSLGYSDDQILADYFLYWKEMMDEGINLNPDEYAAVLTLGQESGPVVTGDAAMLFEWNNYAAKLEDINDQLKIITPPLSAKTNGKGLWVKPGQFFSIAERSDLKREAAEFIDWFINSEEANDIIMGERGIPVSTEIRDYLSQQGSMTEKQKEMFSYFDMALEFCGDTPVPDPIGMPEINELFKNAAYSVFYGRVSAENAAAQFRIEADEILIRNN